MDRFEIRGGNRLAGRLTIKGSKNAALPMMAAGLLTDQPFVLRDIPDLADINNMVRLLGELGCQVSRQSADDIESPGGVFTLRAVDESISHARYDIVRTMRASICVLGPMLARRGYARVSLPGGCSIGERPVDIHLRGLSALGADITLDQGDIIARVPKVHGKPGRLKGTRVFLGGPFGSTVLGTANVMSAATLAEGTTVIECAACEPEIVDLANLLNAMGAKITGQGSPRITIEGVKELGAVDHRIIADRIEAGTYMCAAAITAGDITLDNCPVDALMAHMDRLHHMGVTMQWDAKADPMRASCRITATRGLKPIEVTTQPHPGFPTDLQAQLMAVLCLAEGNSVITERIFTERFLHVAELSRMGAQLYRQGSTVIVSGVRKLTPAPVMASDLRASASLILAGLAAEGPGPTVINRVYHLDRGYEKMELRLQSLGAEVQRISERDEATLAPGVA
ncbi:MAG: UDP-N-acetylglucosamine 1-carboxyvinyltransferase [Phycisphaerales bacterium]|nr:UDP-N-acetylglucosamine 1-carboxyvinyltransferase [Phycisphaerales bacterium]